MAALYTPGPPCPYPTSTSRPLAGKQHAVVVAACAPNRGCPSRGTKAKPTRLPASPPLGGLQQRGVPPGTANEWRVTKPALGKTCPPPPTPRPLLAAPGSRSRERARAHRYGAHCAEAMAPTPRCPAPPPQPAPRNPPPPPERAARPRWSAVRGLAALKPPTEEEVLHERWGGPPSRVPECKGAPSPLVWLPTGSAVLCERWGGPPSQVPAPLGAPTPPTQTTIREEGNYVKEGETPQADVPSSWGARSHQADAG